MNNREVADRAGELLSGWGRHVPDVWNSLEAARFEARAERQWPDWCWLPTDVTAQWSFRYRFGPAATAADLGAWITKSTTPRSEREAFLASTMQLAAAASWRLTRGIYRFDPDLRRALLQTSVEEIAPEVLLQLPEWCLYIDLDDGEQFGRDRAAGFYAHLDWVVREPAQRADWPTVPFATSPILRLLMVVPRGDPPTTVWVQSHLPLHHRSLSEAWEHVGLVAEDMDREQARSEWEAIMRFSLPLLLYLASQEPEVRHRSDPQRHPERRRPQRPAGGPNWWEVGYRIGTALRNRPEPQAAAEVGEEGSGRSPAPHIRRAHYHLYWTGVGRREPRIRWLHPVLVGDREGHDLPPTIRKVESPFS